MHDASDLAFQCGGYGYDEAPVAHRGGYVAVDESVLLCFADDFAQAMADAAGGNLKVVAYAEQLGRGGILHASVAVQHFVNAAHNGGESVDALAHAAQGGVRGRSFLGLAATEERQQLTHGRERALQVEEFLLLKVGALRADAQQRLAHVEEEGLVDLVLFLLEAHELLHLRELLDDTGVVGTELHLALNPFRPESADATPPKLRAYVGKAYLLFKTFLGVDHCLICIFSCKVTTFPPKRQIGVYRCVRRLPGKNLRS